MFFEIKIIFYCGVGVFCHLMMRVVYLPGMVINIEIYIVDYVSMDSCSVACVTCAAPPRASVAARQLLCAVSWQGRTGHAGTYEKPVGKAGKINFQCAVMQKDQCCRWEWNDCCGW